MAKENNSKGGKGLKVFATLLLIISLGLIGAGVYLNMNAKPKTDNKKETKKEETTKTEDVILDISSTEIKDLFEKLSFNDISVSEVDDSVKDFYQTKTDINDDLKLYLALMADEKVRNYEEGQEVTIATADLETTINTLFESPRTDDYKNMNLGMGKVATYDAASKSYSISILGDIVDGSKYYGELYSAVKNGTTIRIIVQSYYASLEQGESETAYKIYKDSKKETALSEETYQELPGISTLDAKNLDSYEFTFTETDGTYRFTSFQKTA